MLLSFSYIVTASTQITIRFKSILHMCLPSDKICIKCADLYRGNMVLLTKLCQVSKVNLKKRTTTYLKQISDPFFLEQ